MSKRVCFRYLVEGRVQGVWFRASTQNKARELGITGKARNLPDGRVEVIACGEVDKLKELHLWLHQGPEKAEVKKVSAEELEWLEFDRFGVE